MRVDIDEVLDAVMFQRQINRVPLDKIELYLGNQLLVIPEETLNSLKFAGLNTCDCLLLFIPEEEKKKGVNTNG